MKNEKKISMQKDFVERNYNKNFAEQQKVFDENRARKLNMKDSELNAVEKVEGNIWRTSLALMKY